MFFEIIQKILLLRNFTAYMRMHICNVRMRQRIYPDTMGLVLLL
jgi:hypothetical protein